MSKRIILSDGRAVEIVRRPKGRDVVAATKVADGQTELVAPAIAAQVITIATSDKITGITMEEILDLDAADYLAIIGAVMGDMGNV